MSIYPHAGQFPPTDFPNQLGRPTPGAIIGFYAVGTLTLAALYVDRDRSGRAANPVTLDTNGNTPIFFADPGDYEARRVVLGVPAAPPVRVSVGADDSDAVLEPAGAAPSGPAGGVLSGTYPNPGFAADMATQAELDAETARAEAAESANTAASAAEAATRAAADTAEAAARSAADASEAATRAAADAANTAASTAETSRAEAAEALLIPLAQRGVAGGVATLDGAGLLSTAQVPPAPVTSVNSRTGTVTGLAEQSALSAETSRAEAAETANASAVTSEASSRAAADTAEAATRANADTTLQTSITAEATARVAADTANATAIAAETTRAEAAEATNATAITGEATTRAGADTANASAISAETSRAQNAEAALTAAAVSVTPAAKSANYTMAANDSVVLATAGAGGFTVTLPASPVVGKRYGVKKIDSGAGVIVVAGSSGTIDGAASVGIAAQYESGDFVFDATNWWRV